MLRLFRRQHVDEDQHLHDDLAQGQHPEVMVIACFDSGAEPGDPFAVRDVAALASVREPDAGRLPPPALGTAASPGAPAELCLTRIRAASRDERTATP